jgi:hypothetical protein
LGNTTKETREEAKRRLTGDLAKNERGYFTVKYDKEKGEYVLGLKGNVNKALSKPHTEAFEMLVQVVKHSDTVTVTVADSFVEKDGAGGYRRGSAENGGVTLRKTESLSGNIEVYLAPKGAMAPVRDISGKPIPTPKSIVASHEVLGHARHLMILGRSSEAGARVIENIVREGRGLPKRAIVDPGGP